MLPKSFYYKTNRLQQLRGFYYTAQFRSVTKAAEFMNITQSTVSMQIKSLERDLNTELFKHNGPQIKLTSIGEKLYLEASQYILGLDQLFQKFNGVIKNQQELNLNIAANQATTLYLLPQIIKNHLDKYKDLNIKIHSARGLEGIKLLQEEKADIIVGPNSFEVPFDYEYHAVFFYKPMLITRPDHPLARKHNLTINEIKKYKIILPPPEMRTIKTIDHVFMQHNFTNKVRLQFDNWEIVKKYVEVGIGITIAAEIAIEETDNLVGTAIDQHLPTISYGYIIKKDIPLTDKLKNFINSVKNYKLKKKQNIFYN